MCFAGVAKGIFRVDSTLDLWARPIPSANRLPIASCTVSAWAASISGCRGQVGMTAVPSSMAEVRAPMVAMTVRASGTASCASQYDEKPAVSASAACSTI